MSRTTSAPLPDTAVQHLIELRDGDGNRTERYRRMAGYRDLLSEAGWPLARLADPLGITRQAVEQWGAGSADRSGHPPVPMPPRPVVREQEPVQVRARPEIDPDAVRRMRELVPLAVKVNGRTPADSPLRKAGEELAELMADAVRSGVSIQRIADTLGFVRNAVAFRLARYGHDDCVPEWTRKYVDRVS